MGVKDNMPLVSIITPCYNSALFIGETIDSVLSQTYLNWEMLIVDDNSNDESVNIIQKYMEKDNRIKIFILEENKGAANARNVGITKAKGDYIAFLDSDDLWYPEKLEEQISFMKEGDLAFSFTSYCLIDDKGENLDIVVNAPELVNYKYLIGNTVIGCLTVMIDRRKIMHIQMPEIQPEDTALWLIILRNGHQAYGLQKILSKYRIVNNSVSRNKIKAAFRYWNLLRYQENISFFKTNFYFVKYALNAFNKNRGNQTHFKKGIFKK
jgi:teichuronic acid biosynthesis glycosyltransferase TuaG